MNWIKTLLLVSVVATACARGSESSTFEADAYVYPGLDSAERFDNGSVTVRWSSVPVSNPVFLIFRRAIDGEYVWSNPFKVVSKNDFHGSLNELNFPEEKSAFCYVVRFTFEGVALDNNITEMCVNALDD